MLKEIPKTNKKLNWICKKYFYQVHRTIVLRCNKRWQHWAVFPAHGPEAPFFCSVKVKHSEIFSFVLLAYTWSPLSRLFSYASFTCWFYKQKTKGNTLLFNVVDPDCLNPDVASDPEFVPDLYWDSGFMKINSKSFFLTRLQWSIS